VNSTQARGKLTATLLILVCTTSTLINHAVAENGNESDESRRYWPRWRGPSDSGVAPHANPPIEWSETNAIRWKIPLPGRGHSTPIVWDDRIYVTTAVPYGQSMVPVYNNAPGAHDNLPVTQRHQFAALAVRRSDGKVLWKKVLHDAIPHEGGHFSGSLSSASPVTDGEHVIVFFGSHGLYCLDRDGELLWKKNLGTMQSRHAHGEGTSPTLYKNVLIVNWDHEGNSFVMALDKRTGKPIWRVKREEVTSWATPIVVQQDGRSQVIISGTDRLRGYDLVNGDVLWECGGLSRNLVASPVAADGMAFAGCSYDTRAVLAVRLAGATGDITDSDQVVWSRRQLTPYVPSPLLYDGMLYYLRHYQGILTRVDTKTGDEITGPLRLNGIRDVYASPVGAAGRVYITDRNGTTIVLRHDVIPRRLARNQLDDHFNASAALVDREIYLRGEKYLYCVCED